MEKFTYRPQNVCPVAISFDLDGDTVHNISFFGRVQRKSKSHFQAA